MKAVVCTGYGPPEVLQLSEQRTPVPKDDQVRIKIHATAVTSSDCIVRGLKLPASMKILARLMLGYRRPRKPVLGLVLAGEVESTGKAVTTLHDGEKVFGFTGFAFGTYAEYICLPQKAVVTSKPSNLGYVEAAAIPYGGLLAMHFLRKGEIGSRRKVLIYGASGAVGTAAVQLAKHFGADVTGVCSTANLDLVSSLGASTVIDYTKEDFMKKGERYDLILVAVGGRVHPPSQEECVKALAPGGAYVSVDQGRPKPLTEDLVLLRQLVEAGELKPVIDRTYPLDETVEAHRYVDKEHKRGNVVITVP